MDKWGGHVFGEDVQYEHSAVNNCVRHEWHCRRVAGAQIELGVAGVCFYNLAMSRLGLGCCPSLAKERLPSLVVCHRNQGGFLWRV